MILHDIFSLVCDTFVCEIIERYFQEKQMNFYALIFDAFGKCFMHLENAEVFDSICYKLAFYSSLVCNIYKK